MKLSIDKVFKWLAIDEDGEVTVFYDKPFYHKGAWEENGYFADIGMFDVYDISESILSKDSLHRRDGDEWIQVRPDLEVDAKVIVWGESGLRFKRHFSHWESDGSMACFTDGCTSHTTHAEDILGWVNYKVDKDQDMCND